MLSLAACTPTCASPPCPPPPWFQVSRKDGSFADIDGEVTKLDVEVLPCTLTRMDLFDKIQAADPAIVRPTGDLVKCMEDHLDGVDVSDLLRDMLVCEESENAELYSKDEKSEFLWHVFERLCLGGACCQFEDRLEHYLEATKRLYKEFVSVHKNGDTGKIEIASVIFRVNGITTDKGQSLFPTTGRQNFCYVALDPLRRSCKVWYHGHVPFW